MSERQRHDQELRRYVRHRMAADMPPNFVGSVMNDVHRTEQSRRGTGWRILAGLATAAAAAVLVMVGLGLIDNGGIGSGSPSPSPSASASSVTPSASPDASPSASATDTAAPSASIEPTTGDGEFGPIHSMTPEEAFGEAQTCDATEVIDTVGETTDISYTISFPAEWFTNESASEQRSACTLFAPQPFELGPDATVPESVAISADLPPGGDFGPGGSFTTNEYTVDGVAAVRYDVEPEPGGFVTGRSVVWIIAIAGGLPAEGNDRPYLALSTTSEDPEQLAEWVEVLDRMVATLDIGE